MAQRESVNPSQEDLVAALQALKLAKPEMGVKSLRAAVKGKNPTWLVSEARVKKIVFEAGLESAGSENPLADTTAAGGGITAFQQQQQEQQMQFQQQQMQFQQQQMLFQQQQMRQMQDLTASMQMTMKIMSESQEKQQLQMQELASAMTTTMKNVSEKLTLVESGLSGLAKSSGETSVDKLQSLDEFKVSSVSDRENTLPSSGIRTAVSVSIQQPTIAQVQTAPSSEVAGQKGLTDGGFVNVSKQATISTSSSAIRVLRTAVPAGANGVNHTLAVVVPETEKLNPASYSEITIREPGRPEIRVPVLPRPEIRCPHHFKLFDPLSNKEISGKVTLTNLDRPDQPPFVLRVPGEELKLSDLKEGKYTMKIEAEGRNTVIVERVVAFGPRRDRSRDLILNLVMEKFDLSLRSTFSEGKQLRAVLTWKDHPRDLDLHLLSFNCRTWQLVTHCFFKTKGSKLGLQHGECLHLDRDDIQVRNCVT